MKPIHLLLVLAVAAALWGAWMFRYDCDTVAGRLVCHDRWTQQRVVK